MERGKENEGEREKGEANNSAVSFSALRKDVDLIEKLKLVLAIICTFVQLSYSDLEQFEDVTTAQRQEVKDMLRPILDDVDNNTQCKYNMHHVFPNLVDYMDDCISSHNRSKSSATMTKEQLDFLLLNLHHLSKYLAEQVYPLVTQYEILQNVCGNIKDFHGLIVNGCIEHEIVEDVLPQLQPMAERVGLLLLDGLTSEDSRVFKLACLFLIPIELEVMNICFTHLKASKSAEVGCFIKKLLETSPDILREYLIHLQEHMANVITASTSGAQNYSCHDRITINYSC